MKPLPLIFLSLLSCAVIGCAVIPSPLQQGDLVKLPYPIYESSKKNLKTPKENEESVALEVFADIKAKWRPTRDEVLYGVRDYWATPQESRNNDLTGDCEDFATFTREELAQRGVDSRLVLVTGWGSDRHVITVTKLGYVLDMNLVGVASLSYLDYKIIAVTGFHEDNNWYQPTP